MNDSQPTPSRVEAWFSRVFGDDAPKRFGTGWTSGVLSVLLGASALGAVLTLHFPAWLSSAELRSAYPMGTMRMLIGAVIGAAFLLAAVSLMLRRRKTLGLVGLACTGAAMLLGGAGVPIEARPDDTPFYLGLDWFLLNLLLLALVFVPLERAFPRVTEQRVFRFGWATDGAHFLVSHLAVQVLTFLSLLPASWLAARSDGSVSGLVRGQPLWIQVIEIMLVADVTQYWVHRAFHRIRWLWPFHAVHHSSRVLDWLAGSRLHLVDVIATRALVLVPLFVLGFAEPALYAWLVVVAFHAVFNHVNLRFRLRWIEPILVTPRFHHWHHAATPADKNFAVHFPWLDRLFGTFWMPDGAWPQRLGLSGDPVPEGWLAQTAHPFRELRQWSNSGHPTFPSSRSARSRLRSKEKTGHPSDEAAKKQNTHQTNH